MPSETILLLKAWQEGMSAVELKRHVIANGLLPKATNYRTSDLVSRVFAPRYLSSGATAAKNLKYLLALSVPADRLLQLFLIYTRRGRTSSSAISSRPSTGRSPPPPAATRSGFTTIASPTKRCSSA